MKSALCISILFILLIALFQGGSAEERDTVPLSLSDCLNIGLANNLDIKIAKIESKIAGQDIMLSEAVFDTLLSGDISYEDDRRAVSSVFMGDKNLTNTYAFGASKKMFTGTEVSIDYYDIRNWTNQPKYVDSNPYHTAEISFSARQPVSKNFFGFIDRKNVKLARIDVAIADIQALNRIEDSVADIEKAYWRLVFAYENVSLFKELFEQAEKLYKIYDEHAKTGFVEETDLYETQANMETRKTELYIVENDLEDASNNLRLLLNEDGDFLIAPRDNLVIFGAKADLGESLNEALIANRDYKIKKKELDAKKVRLAIKENSLWPEIDLVGTFALNGVDRKAEKANRRLTTDKNPYYYAGVEVSVPLENRRAHAEYNKASLDKEKAIVEIIKVEKTLITRIDEAVRAVNLHLQNARRWTEIRKLQYNKMMEEAKKLKYGRTQSKTLIDYQRDFTRAAISEYTAILEYYYALIDLENAKDKLLEKTGVTGI